jgi:hypothetical protein
VSSTGFGLKKKGAEFNTPVDNTQRVRGVLCKIKRGDIVKRFTLRGRFCSLYLQFSGIGECSGIDSKLMLHRFVVKVWDCRTAGHKSGNNSDCMMMGRAGNK